MWKKVKAMKRTVGAACLILLGAWMGLSSGCTGAQRRRATVYIRCVAKKTAQALADCAVVIPPHTPADAGSPDR